MNCPKCNAKANGTTARIREQSLADVELGQQRRARRCHSCGHCWQTFEMDAGEVSRLRVLAHRETMRTVA